MRSVGLVAAMAALAGLVIAVCFHKRLQPPAYHWLLLVCLLILPGTALLSTISTVSEDTKSLGSCATCHVMQPFINDMLDPESRTLAARHYQNRWIPTEQCYTCHTTYGLHGALAAKQTAIRHWVRYVTGSWTEPITHNGSYPNVNCLDCHANAARFLQVGSHQSHLADLRENRVGCVMCHGRPHPTPEDKHELR
jgi:cytochrome c nitrite reductase small subunit